MMKRVRTSLDTQINLVPAKARVRPTKEITIPRMELLAATLGARVVNSFSKIKDFSETQLICWTDASTVLSWIRQGRQ